MAERRSALNIAGARLLAALRHRDSGAQRPAAAQGSSPALVGENTIGGLGGQEPPSNRDAPTAVHDALYGRTRAAVDRLGALLASAAPPDTPEAFREHAAMLNAYDHWQRTLSTGGTADELAAIYAEVMPAQRRAARWVPR
ncbi:hypothetical protein F4561_004326 [Lipingzhangella halophila]|uniref:Uncharacterized protein n=1 Tax=Lipingzhangella halophila TaxID=1783352 RepID=A0A7W7RL45_9ACTN|nr:hypothetical protein [Lipingzhangella halophila]MBB4933506.1 hypothetical protein [Lipingzhangella halophila]